VSLPAIEVGVDLGIANDGEFILDDPVRGVLDSEYVLGTGYSSVTGDSYSIGISRGRFSRLWDTADAGSASVNVYNMDRSYDPSYLDSPFAGYIVPGRGVRVSANDIDLFTGFVDDWNLEYDVSGMSTASLMSTDALGMFGQLQFDAWTNTATDANSKLSAICDRAEVAWSAVMRDFDGGTEVLQSDSVSWGSNVLTYAQLIARSELGYLFASPDGMLTFRARDAAVESTLAFGDDGVGIPYQGITATIGSELLFSRVSVDREGGTSQTAIVDDTSAWIAAYGPMRSLSVTGLLLADDSQALAQAEYLLSIYDTPRYRVSELKIDVTPLDSSTQDEVLAVDITDVIDVTFTPNSVGAPIMQTLVVQGIRHDISVSRHVVTFSTIDAPFPFFRLDDADYGVLDQNILGF
jgi:hypothetical protein